MCPQGITVKRGHGLSYGKHMPLQPILEFFRDYFEIVEADRRSRHAKRSRAGWCRSACRCDDLPVFFDFMEVADPQRPIPQMPAEERMRRIFDMVRRVTPRRSDARTLVLVFEDLHWFDAASEAFLEELIESYPGTRTLIVTNFRPEFHARWMRHSYYRQIALSPLGSDEARAMVGGLVGEEASLGPLVDSLTERTSGNPFFLEEVVRSLIEDGTLERTAADTSSRGPSTAGRAGHRPGRRRRTRRPASRERQGDAADGVGHRADVLGADPVPHRAAAGGEVVASLRALCSAEFLARKRSIRRRSTGSGIP